MIEAVHLTKSFGNKKALNDISFKVQAGEILVILGANGAGKTTLLRLLSILLKPDNGYTKIADLISYKDGEKIRNIIGCLTEVFGFYPRMNLTEYIEFFGKMYGISATEIKKKTFALAKLLKLEDHLNYSLETFSKGMKQKTALIRALIHSPKYLFLDEPTSALDPEGAKIVRDYIKQLSSKGITVIACTHNLQEAESLASKIAILKKGKFIFWGDLIKLREILLGNFKFKICLTKNNLQEKQKEIQKFFLEKNIKYSLDLKNNFLFFETNTPLNLNPLIIKFLILNNLEIISCEEIKPSLEQAYLKYGEI